MAGISKVVYGNKTLVDLTGDNVTAESLVVGTTAHGKDGNIVAGTNPYEKKPTDAAVNTQSNLIAQIKTALAGKAAGSGGSGSTDVCTVTFDNEYFGGDCDILFVSAIVIENGERKSYTFTPNVTYRESGGGGGVLIEHYEEPVYNLTIPNVACDTYITMMFNMYGRVRLEPYLEFSGSGVTLESWAPYPDDPTITNHVFITLKVHPSAANTELVIRYSYPA